MLWLKSVTQAQYCPFQSIRKLMAHCHIKRSGLLLCVAALLAGLAHGQVYRCTTPDGKTVLSDKECEKGARKDGHTWVSVEEDQRRRDEDAQSRLRAAERERQVRERQQQLQAEAARAKLQNPPSVQRQNIDRLTTYSVMIGRAIGCGIPTENASRRVGRWFDQAFEPAERTVYLAVLLEGTRHHALLQRKGETPDSCSQVASAFAKFPWP